MNILKERLIILEMLRWNVRKSKKIIILISFVVLFMFIIKHLNTTNDKTILLENTIHGNSIKSIINNNNNNNNKKHNGKLVTQFTTFADVADGTNEGDNYRRNAQVNYLQSTTFTKTQINYVIYTNCTYWVNLINNEYSHISILPIKLVHPFSTPLIKHMALGAMDTYDTPFYMFANADNLYDNSLISTTTTIFDAIKSGEMSTKVLIIGHRFNVKTNDRIGTEIEIKKLKQISETNKPFAKDYAIFTRDTYDWAGFPDMLVARRFFDSFMVDFAFHNEIQMVDATATIPLVHQVKQLGYSTSLYADQGETDWNEKIFGVKTSHSSILCSEFQTIHSDKEIMIYDKVKHTFLSTNLVTKFSEGYNTAIRNIQNTRKGEYFDNSDLTFVVVTLNKPHSLERLITQLNNVAYNCHLNLAIIVNRGKTQLFDLQTLNVVSNSKWVHGDKLIHLSHKHLTQLEQWLEVDKLGITQFILFQDDVTLSTYFYIALTKAMDSIKESISWLEGNIGGVSLEPPLTFPPNSKAYLKLSAQYQDNLVMSQPINSRALFPNPLVWRLFSDWARETINSNKFNIKDLGNTFAARNINYGDKTDWYKTIAGVWFCYYLELTHRTLGYLKHPKGVIATWGYRGLEGTNNFLGYNCSLKNVIIKTQIPILTDENPKFRFSGNPPVIKIEEIDKLY